MLFSELCELFLSHHRRQSAPRTVLFYRTQLRLLGRALGPLSLEQIGPAVCLQALDCAGQGKAQTTQRHTSVALDQIQKWAVANGIIERPWLAKVPKPCQSLRTRIATRDETRALLSRAKRRFRLIYSALRLSGARPGELTRAQIGDYHRERGAIILQAHKTARKTGKPRIIAVGKKFAKILAIAIGKRTEGPIFRTPRGRAWTVNNLSCQFARLRDRAGLSRELVLYSARHEAGTEFCRKKGLHMASQLLGHSSVATTQRYVHPEFDELRAAQDGTDL